MKNLLVTLATFFWLNGPSLMACATCSGKSDAPMAQGMNAGIMALMVVVGGVLTGIASFFVFIVRRENLNNNSADPDENVE